MNRFFLVISLFLLCISSSYAQKGKDGAKTIAAAGTVVNEYTSLTNDVSAGDAFIKVSSSSLNTNNRFAGPLAKGDLLMIIQMQGATINATTGDSTWGAVMGYNNCGMYEFVEVTSVPDASTININCSIKNNYTAAGKVQVVRVPRYSSLTVNANDTLTCDPWNGTQGGVAAVEVSGNTTVNAGGAIDATAKGFRGGAVVDAAIPPYNYVYGVPKFASNGPDSAGQKGEGIAGYQADYTQYGGMYSRGAPANGGGGGNAGNSAGGGGANGGDITLWTGNGNPDITNTQWMQAWNLEYNGFANSTSSGGGRGGYCTYNVADNPLTTPPGNTSWGTVPWCYRQSYGGKGGRPLDYSSGRLFLGGGGGSGQENNNNGGAGGNGGGMVYIISGGTISGSGTVSSNGQNGLADLGGLGGPAFGDGSGGGGGGGTIVLNSTGSISGISIYANGGAGGNQVIIPSPTEGEGGGGGGGGGYIAITNGAVTRQASGGIYGTTNSPSMTQFASDGATSGGGGMPNETALPLSLSSIVVNAGPDTTICNGQSVALYGTGGDSTITTYSWSPATGLSNTNTTHPVASPTITTTYTLTASNGSCPGKDSVVVTVIPKIILTPVADTSICSNQSTSLNPVGSSSYNYSWSPSAGLNCTSCANPVASPTVTSTYTVIASSQYCSDTSQSVVSISSSPNLTLQNAAICTGQSIALSGSRGDTTTTTYSWSPSGGLSSTNTTHPVAGPTITTTYTLTATSASCSGKDSVVITVIPKIILTPIADSGICANQSLSLNPAGSSSYSYEWSPSVGLSCTNCTNPSASPSVPTTYTVIATNQNCSDTSQSVVTISPSPTLNLQNIAACYGQPTTLSTSSNGTLTWSPPDGLSCTECDSPQATLFSNTTYLVTATIGNCSVSDSIQITVDEPSISASGDTTVYSGTVVQLFASGAQQYMWNPSNTLSSDSVSNPQATPSVTTTYSVTGFDSFGCAASAEVVVTVNDPCQIPVVPNAFSPNGDGQNDIFKLLSLYADKLLAFNIYNRWGQLVFQTTDLNEGWDGTFDNKPEPVGAYVYYIKILCRGNAVSFKGSVTLIR